MINKVVQYTITCDNDGCWNDAQTIVGEDETWDKESAIKEFRSRGWKISKKNICPDCSQTHRKTTK